jgi:hypothetical protein
MNMVHATTIRIQKIHIIKETEYKQQRYASAQACGSALTSMQQTSCSDVQANLMGLEINSLF